MSAFRNTIRAVMALAAAVIAAPPSYAIDAGQHLQPRAVVAAPAGAANLCSLYDWACATSQSPAAPVPADAMAIVRQVNTTANRAIRPITDMQQYSVEERWSLPTLRGGDCEDYALFKKRALIVAGIPPERLLLASVLDRNMQPHAVLIVRLGRSDLVLDNLTGRILTWQQTGYTFLRMQNPQRPDTWVALLTGGALS